MGTNIAELQQLLAKKDVRIRELEVENMTLRSQLDQYKSVFDPGQTTVNNKRKTARGVGISAEPQSLASLKDLTTKTFPSYKKSDKAQELIRSAIMDNDFMKNLETSQIKVSYPTLSNYIKFYVFFNVCELVRPRFQPLPFLSACLTDRQNLD